jgi:hypothetical protein
MLVKKKSFSIFIYNVMDVDAKYGIDGRSDVGLECVGLKTLVAAHILSARQI